MNSSDAVNKTHRCYNLCTYCNCLQYAVICRHMLCHDTASSIWFSADCDDGNYGINCNESCGHCKKQSKCSITDGNCPSGCEPWYILDDCKTYIGMYTCTNLIELYRKSLCSSFANIPDMCLCFQVESKGIHRMKVLHYVVTRCSRDCGQHWSYNNDGVLNSK